MTTGDDFTKGAEAAGKAASDAYGIARDAAKDATNALREFFEEGNIVNNGLTDMVGGLKAFSENMAGVPGSLAKLTAGTAAFYTETVFLEKGLKGLISLIPGVGSDLGMLGKILDIASEPTRRLADNQVTAAINFNKSTAAAGLYDEKIAGMVFNLRKFGVSGGEAGKHLLSLHDNFTDLTIGGITPSEEKLIELSAILGEFGVPADVASGAMQDLRKVFGQSDEEIGDTLLGLKAFSFEAGLSASAVIGSFQKQTPYLARFGDDAVRVFKDMEAAAKSSGVATSDMIDVSKQFDRFDTATETVGRLNALLSGPYLNTIDLMRATNPADRMRIVSEAFDAAGKSAEDMNEFQLLAFSNALRMGDDVSGMVKMIQGDYDSLIPAIGAVGDSQAELASDLAAGRTADENRKIVEETAIAIDGFGEAFLEFNKNAFPVMMDSAENFRKEISTWEPIVKNVVGAMKSMVEPLGITPEGVREAGDEALRASAERAAPGAGDAARLGHLETPVAHKIDVKVYIGERELDKQIVEVATRELRQP